MSQKKRNLFAFTSVATLSLLVAQVIGVWINNNLAQGETLVINSLLHFTHIRNYGGVFGMFQGKGWFFGMVSISLLIAVVVYLCVSRDLKRYEYICFGFIVGGGASNILDRLMYGSVIDFINVQNIPFWHYIFNTADVMVHIGIWPMLFLSFFGGEVIRKR